MTYDVVHQTCDDIVFGTGYSEIVSEEVDVSYLHEHQTTGGGGGTDQMVFVAAIGHIHVLNREDVDVMDGQILPLCPDGILDLQFLSCACSEYVPIHNIR